jgi:hypothetical protein
LAAEAQRLGYDQDPAVLRVAKQQAISMYLTKDFEAKLKVEDVPEADVLAYYDAHRSEFAPRSLADVSNETRASCSAIGGRRLWMRWCNTSG